MRCRVHDILEIFFETTYYYSSDQSKHQVFPFPRCTVAHLQPNSQGFIQVLHLDCVCVGAGCALLLGSDRDELVRRIPRLLNGANSIRFDYPGPSGNTFSFCFGHDSSRTLQTCTERTAPIFFFLPFVLFWLSSACARATVYNNNNMGWSLPLT